MPSSHPMALQNLLAVGILFLPIPASAEQQRCDHKHVEDGWHEFKRHKFDGLLSKPEDIAFCDGLQHLITQDFVRATHQNNANGWVSLRIYLIPDDLPGMMGVLRNRQPIGLQKARASLQAILPKIITSKLAWDGVWFDKIPRSQLKLLLPECKDSSWTLAEIYSNLPSPQPAPVPECGGITSRLLDFEDDLEGLGLRSTLYTYQRRSVAAMLQKELDMRDVPNPLFIPLTTVDNKTFYFQPGTMEVLLDRPFMSPARGGILCEELGTGKTVMTLALICATRGQISSPEPSMIESRPVLTPLAFRHFPSSDYIAARQQLGVNYRTGILQRKPTSPTRVPSLVELLIHHARAAPSSHIPNPHGLSDSGKAKAFEHQAAIADRIANSEMEKAIRANVPFYLKPQESLSTGRSERLVPTSGPAVVYLTSATLVVVPANLISQWDREILKHAELPLRVLIMRPKTPWPSVQSLATDYDIILMPYTRFTMESKHANINKQHERRVCTCPEHRSIRVPNCTCGPIQGVSPLLQIRWKRLVLDEGHNSASRNTTLVPFAEKLKAERRWIITGTPTTNLLGLSFGSQTAAAKGDDASEEHVSNISSTTASPSTSRLTPAETTAGGNLATSSAESSPPPPTYPNRRVWTPYDKQDLTKLGNMISHFLCVPQFHANPKLVGTHIIEPLLDKNGPRGGSIDVLRQIMDMQMIRHRIDDVEKDVVLPPVTQESVLLDLDPLVIKSYNALQALLIINAVDSERKDQDYMFHPQNAGALAETVQNMSQILFWHVDEEKYNAPALVRDAEASIQRAISRGMVDSDVRALKAAFDHLKWALDDPLWVQVQSHEDIPYRVHDLQSEIFHAWSRTRSGESAATNGQTGMVHVDRLIRLHDKIMERPLMSVSAIAEAGQKLDMIDRRKRDAYAAKHDKRRSNTHPLKTSDSDAVSAKLLADESSKKASSSEHLKEMQQELFESLKKLEVEQDMDGDDIDIQGHSDAAANSESPPKHFDRPILASSQLAKMRVGSSASTKINYIINEVKKYSKDEKFLIFSASPLSLAHVAEALELIHVKFLRFTTQIPAHLREQLVLTFETSETYRVFLMELKHGARGLNLISASRVIFCEPVWQADVESQAIKRVHRIGQTRPINVKVLAIRDTAEEQMVHRRNALNHGSQGKIPKLLEEKGMRDYIQNPTFITRQPTPTLVPEFPLLNIPPELLQPRPGAIMLKIPPLRTLTAKRTILLGHPSDENKEPEQKKRKLTVTFA